MTQDTEATTNTNAPLAVLPRLAESLSDLFGPVDDAPVASLITAYARERATIERLAGTFAEPETAAVLAYYTKGNDLREAYGIERMFSDPCTTKALKALDASYWQQALDATDVLSSMPAKRREEWRKQIDAFDVPPFAEDALRSTLTEHLASRTSYFAERVDGVFRALSPDHRTNIAAGFRSKMIIQHVTHDWYSATSRVDYLVDLRIVVARFMGRPIEHEYQVNQLTRKLVSESRQHQRGEWVTVDGGAIEVRLYDNGNCHVRVHEEIAWRLNAVLASVNPGAIPESNRTRPAYTGRKKAVAPKVELVTRPLPFAVLRVLSDYSTRRVEPRVWSHNYTWGDVDKHVKAEVLDVLASLGGAGDDCAIGSVRFAYDATDVIREVLASGCVPDQRAHQYYPTPRHLAERVVALAEIGPADKVLEPSAGQGAIAELLPRDRTLCVEASALHCAVLRAKGFTVHEGDFLQVDTRAHARPDVTRVVMNPPFDRGQWRAHVEHAARLLASSPCDRLYQQRGVGARLVAILPASAPAKFDLPGFDLVWSAPIEGAFAGTSIAVVILTATRSANV